MPDLHQVITRPSVANAAALTAIDVSKYDDGIVCEVITGVTTDHALYVFDKTSTETADGDRIIASSETTGRWVKTASPDLQNIVNNVTSTSVTQPLSANQGKLLNDAITGVPAGITALPNLTSIQSTTIPSGAWPYVAAMNQSVANNVSVTFNGCTLSSDLDFSGTGGHEINFPDPGSGSAGRFVIRLDAAGEGHISHNGSGTGITIYNNAGWLKHTGWDGSKSTTVFKSHSSKGDLIFAAPVSAVDNSEMVSNTGGAADTTFGSVHMYLDEGANELKFKVLYSDGTTFKSASIALT